MRGRPAAHSVQSTPMDAMKNLVTAYSTREFLDRPIAEDTLKDMLRAARWCGSSRNSQPWNVIVIRDRATLRALAEIIPYGKHMASAPMGIAFAIEGAGRGQSLDAGRISQNVMLAANAHGVGTCISTIADDERDRQACALLGVPDGWSVRSFLSIGYPRPRTPEEAAAAKARPNRGRKPYAQIVSYERFGKPAP